MARASPAKEVRGDCVGGNSLLGVKSCPQSCPQIYSLWSVGSRFSAWIYKSDLYEPGENMNWSARKI